MRSRIRQTLSSLKSHVISRDFQDIYQFNHALERGLLAAPIVNEGFGENEKPDSGRTELTYRIHDSLQVLKLIEHIHPMDEQGRLFARSRLGAGDKAVIGYDGDLPVFYGWLMFEEIEMTYSVFMPVPQGIAFGYNLFTKISHRRRGAMTGFYDYVHNYLKQKDFHTIYIGISTNNRSSIKAHLKSGFEKVGYFYTLKMFGTCFTLANFAHAKRFYIN